MIRHRVKTVVKSKSMVTEEIQLAAALEKVGATVWETDLGEYIVQLRKEPPYHIVTPAMHLNREQIGDLFREKLEPDLSNDPQELVAAARRKLRQAFFSAEMGISGANFIVADAGVIAISTNEGNGRLSTSVPRDPRGCDRNREGHPQTGRPGNVVACAGDLWNRPADYDLWHINRGTETCR